MIVAEQLTKTYGETVAVDRASFSVEKGETLALLGRSGSGKTTTLKMLNRIVEPTSGTVTFKGEAVDALPAHELRRQMGYVIQQSGLFPHYTVAENVAVVPKLLSWEERRIAERTEALLERLGIPAAEYADKRPAQLSGGERQRVGIARALAADPPVVLMDEPFGALDPVTRQGIRKEFKELEELRSKTVVMVTHDVEEAFELADRVCLMDAGRIQQQGRPCDLLFSPASDFVARFFDAQRLALQMSALTLADVLPEANVKPYWKPDIAPLASTVTVKEAADAYAEKGALSVEAEGGYANLDMGTLMGAFNAAVNRLSAS